MATLVSLLVTGLIVYASVRKYRNGEGLVRSIGWFVWTTLWLGVLAALVGEPFGETGATVVYLAYGVLRVHSLTQERQADEFFTGRYGSLIRYRVTYLGGHPQYRTTGVKGLLLVTQSGLILVKNYRANAATLCMIPLDRILRSESMGAADRVVAWTNGMPVPVTFTASEQGSLVVQFANDVNDISAVTFRVGNGQVAASLKNHVDYAVYDWKRTCMGGL